MLYSHTIHPFQKANLPGDWCIECGLSRDNLIHNYEDFQHMPIKFTEHAPPPIPQPPTTYGIEGLSRQQMRFVMYALQSKLALHASGSITLGVEEHETLNRVIAVIKAKV